MRPAWRRSTHGSAKWERRSQFVTNGVFPALDGSDRQLNGSEAVLLGSCGRSSASTARPKVRDANRLTPSSAAIHNQALLLHPEDAKAAGGAIPQALPLTTR